ncbi:hypothetical protein DFH06DRAFT_1328128 [Mycena polygramma]|nr:hypothetical protein DFH06DRAFT_1328128 [Mycena polygramma]
MAARRSLAASPQPTFPEDIERAVNEVLLSDTREMCRTMRLVASRFETWTRPVMFHTAVVHRHNDWMQRVRESLLPNGSLIRILVLDLALGDFDALMGRPGEKSSEEELSLLRRLLSACGQVNHIAVTWNIWSQLQSECGALPFQSLYLMWDGEFAGDSGAPSLDHLQHPEVLKDLTISAPGDLRGPSWSPTSYLSLPPREQTLAQCVNLAYITYASDQSPVISVASFEVEWTTLVLTKRPGGKPYHAEEETSLQRDRDRYPNHSIVCMEEWDQVLEEWVAKMEGRESLLSQPIEIA